MFVYILNIITYLAIIAGTFLAFKTRCSVFVWLGIYMVLFGFLAYCTQKIINSQISTRKKVYMMRLNGFFLTIYTAIFPMWWMRLVCQIIVPLNLPERKLANNDKYDNALSRHNTYIYTLFLSWIINIIRLRLLIPSDFFSSSEQFHYITQPFILKNILAVIVPIIVFCFYKNDLVRVRKYDRDVRLYKATPYAQSTHYSYDDVMSDQGKYGEFLTSLSLRDMKCPYEALFEVCIPDGGKVGSSEIDMIVVTVSGIKCVEVKNKAGEWRIIEGEKNAQIRYNSNYGYEECQSPLSQNENHVKALRNLLWENGYKKFAGCVSGYLAFGPHTKGINIQSQSQGYGMYNEIGRLIFSSVEKCLEAKKMVLDDEEILSIYNFLSKYEDDELRQTHTKRVQFYQEEEERKAREKARMISEIEKEWACYVDNTNNKANKRAEEIKRYEDEITEREEKKEREKALWNAMHPEDYLV